MANKFDPILGKYRQSDADGSGDVVGPTSSTDKGVVLYDGSTGKLVKNSSSFVQDASGNVGIGTTTPTGIFQVNSLASYPGTVATTNGSFYLTGTGTTFLTTFKKGDRVTVGAVTYNVRSIATDTSLTLNPNPTVTQSGVAYTSTTRERLFIGANGQAGIGTADPTSAGLHIVSSVQGGTDTTDSLLLLENPASTDSTTFGITIGTPGSYDKYVRFFRNSTEVFQIDSSQSSMSFLTPLNISVGRSIQAINASNVGTVAMIGLDTTGNVNVGNNYPTQDVPPFASSTAGDTIFYVGGSRKKFYWKTNGSSVTNNTSIMTLSGTGALGIGTVTPDALLQVSRSFTKTPSVTGGISDYAGTIVDGSTAPAGTVASVAFNSFTAPVFAAGAVITTTVTAGGSGYTTAPLVTIANTGTQRAIATANISAGAVTSITMVYGGAGFTVAPSVTFSGGAGTGATATANINGAGGVVTATDAHTVYIAGAPTVGTNTAITNAYSLFVNGGTAYFGGNVGFSNNVRGFNVGVTATSTTHTVTFPTAHADTNYAVMCTPSWNTTCYVTGKSTTGFTLNFGTASGATDTVDWFVVR